MKKFYYEIGKIKLELNVFEDELIQTRMQAYLCEPFAVPDARITITLADKIERDKSYNIIAAASFRGYGVNKTNDYAIFDRLDSPDNLSAALFVDKDCKETSGILTDIEPLGGASVSVRAFNMIGELFKYIAIKNNGFVFHSSTLDFNGRGILFSANSGTGKSTHTQLWLKYYPTITRIINDDSPLIRLIDGKAFVFGTPWSGKTDINDNICCPLEAIVFIQRAEQSSIEALNFEDAFKRFVEQSFIMPYSLLFINYLETAEKVLKQTLMTILNCNISKEAVDTIKAFLEEKNENKE